MDSAKVTVAEAVALHPAARVFPAWAQNTLRESGEVQDGAPGERLRPDERVILLCRGVMAAIDDAGICISLYGPGAVIGLEAVFMNHASAPQLEVVGGANWIAAPLLGFRSSTGLLWAERMCANQAVGRQRWLSTELRCALQHAAMPRLARWLLALHDLLDRPRRMVFTQQQLADLLYMRRTTVNALLSTLADAGVVGVGRGYIAELDESALRQRACVCHQPREYPKK